MDSCRVVTIPDNGPKNGTRNLRIRQEPEPEKADKKSPGPLHTKVYHYTLLMPKPDKNKKADPAGAYATRQRVQFTLELLLKTYSGHHFTTTEQHYNTNQTHYNQNLAP